MKNNGKALRVIVPAFFIIALLIAVSLPFHLKARKQSQRNACLNNLRMLTAPMVCCVPLSMKLKVGDKMDPKMVCQFIKGSTMPVCPAGGEYIVSWIVGGPTPKCSFHGDLLLDVDHFKNLRDAGEADYKAKEAQRTNSAYAGSQRR